MFVIAWIPPLWFRIMDGRLMALPHVDGDLGKVNVDPQALPRLRSRWGQPDPDFATARQDADI